MKKHFSYMKRDSDSQSQAGPHPEQIPVSRTVQGARGSLDDVELEDAAGVSCGCNVLQPRRGHGGEHLRAGSGPGGGGRGEGRGWEGLVISVLQGCGWGGVPGGRCSQCKCLQYDSKWRLVVIGAVSAKHSNSTLNKRRRLLGPTALRSTLSTKSIQNDGHVLCLLPQFAAPPPAS